MAYFFLFLIAICFCSLNQNAPNTQKIEFNDSFKLLTAEEKFDIIDTKIKEFENMANEDNNLKKYIFQLEIEREKLSKIKNKNLFDSYIFAN